MEIPKAPATDAIGGNGRNVATGNSAATSAARQDQSAPPPPPLPAGDLALIRALDPNSALQILLTEVFDALGLAPPPTSSSNAAPADAARATLNAFLQALPADQTPPVPWLTAVDELQNTVVAAMDRAIGTVAAWRDASPPVVDAVRDSRVVVLAALAGDAPAIAPRPEWAGLAPALVRFQRRRRRARRLAADPEAESSLWNLDDSRDPIDYD